MSGLVSRPYRLDPGKCCEACAFGRGEHETWCDAQYPAHVAATREEIRADCASRD